MALSPDLLLAIHTAATEVFDESDWKQVAYMAGKPDLASDGSRLLVSLNAGTPEYSREALQTIRSIIAGDDRFAAVFLSIPALRVHLSHGAGDFLNTLIAVADRGIPELPRLLQVVLRVHPAVCAAFTEADWRLFGIHSDLEAEIDRHPRLLRSLHWDDPDYPGHVLHFLDMAISVSEDNIRFLMEFPSVVSWLQTNDPQFFVDFGVDSPVRSSQAQPRLPALPRGIVSSSMPLNAAARLSAIEAGPASATLYHRLVRDLLDAAFLGQLSDPIVEKEIHEGQKRIDIAFTNRSNSGFFHWLNANGFRCPNLFVECKNYSVDPHNPDVDQLAGRFSKFRGQVGFLVFRTLDNADALFRRCNKTLSDERGLIIPISDVELAKLHDAASDIESQFKILKAIFDKVVQ